ncbi:unnamed protein product [Caenorhabditis auriculariae]|uniref:cyclin-dependent kinase n=1 Tax=Caenorhabditis auriculariae TaxID=2777116 RepID=A0A8S1H478_9PELO|nr:unnamed protein product [Caenorhabditis auriculariae]
MSPTFVVTVVAGGDKLGKSLERRFLWRTMPAPLQDVTKRRSNVSSTSHYEQKPKSQLSDYIISEELGKGAYGVVYQVKEIKTNKEYALKQINVSVNEEGIPQSVLRELSVMKSLTSLRHPNVLGLVNVFHTLLGKKEGMKINMIVEKCDWDLHLFLKGIPRNCPEKQCRHIARQIFIGLDFLHEHNIIHRDLKPQNILINRNQEIKIADFGLSRMYSNTSAFTSVAVTLWYRAPELLLLTEYGSSSDIWSAGCIISEVYHREPLFAGDSEAGQLWDILGKQGVPEESKWPHDAIVKREAFISERTAYPRDIQTLNPSLSPEAAAVVRECVKFSADSRPTAQRALKMPYFKSPRESAESPVPPPSNFSAMRCESSTPRTANVRKIHKIKPKMTHSNRRSENMISQLPNEIEQMKIEPDNDFTPFF